MSFGLKITTEPATEIITTALAKTYLQVTDSNSDTLIDTLITAARREVERITERALIDQTWQLDLDAAPVGGASLNDLKAATGWPIDANLPGLTSAILLPKSPLSSITSIVYFDQDNSESTFSSASYRADTTHTPGRVVLNDGYSWPSDLRETQSIRITYVVGYGTTASSVPPPLITAAYQILYNLYHDRGSGHDPAEIQDSTTKTEKTLRSWRVGGYIL